MRNFQSLSRGKRYLFLCLMVLPILLVIGGFFFVLEPTFFAHSNSLAVASPTTQVTITVPSPTATPSSITTPSSTTSPSPTATPSPTPRPLPTATPSPTTKPSPVILAVTPRNFYFKNCARNINSYTCTFTLSNSSSIFTLAWTAKAWNSQDVNVTHYLSPTSGTLTKRGTTTALLFIAGETGVCPAVGNTVYLQFTGPKNSVTVTVTC